MTKPESSLNQDACEFPGAQRLVTELWAGLQGSPKALSRLQFSGPGEMNSPFPVLDFAGAAFGVAGLAVSELMRAADLGSPRVTVDRRQSATWFDIPLAPSRFLDRADQHGIHQRWMAEFRTADDRWIRVQAMYPTLRSRMLLALELPETAGPDDVAEAVRKLPADAAEDRLVSGGAAVAVARTRLEWEHHPQGVAVAAEPIAAITPTLTDGSTWAPTPGRPLLGIRVLDMSRVVAAPMATRFLAALGAQVLRIDGPSSDETLFGISDVMLGKRWAVLDARTRSGRERLHALVASADVMVHGYRPGAMESLGLDEATRSSLRPGLVDVTLNAYGWSGPWQHRRGFDTLVQYSTGIADEVSRWAAEAPEQRVPINALGHLVDASRPRHLPVEALDFGTGYLLAAAAVLGLARRLNGGVGSVTRMSLARTSRLLIDHVTDPKDPTFTLPDSDALLHDRIYEMNGRPTRRLKFPVSIEDNPLFWDRPAEAAGSSSPVWADAVWGSS